MAAAAGSQRRAVSFPSRERLSCREASLPVGSSSARRKPGGGKRGHLLAVLEGPGARSPTDSGSKPGSDRQGSGRLALPLSDRHPGCLSGDGTNQCKAMRNTQPREP